MLSHKLILFCTLIPIVLSYYIRDDEDYDYGDGIQNDRHSNQRLPSISTRSGTGNNEGVVMRVQGDRPAQDLELERPLIEGPITWKVVDKVIDKQGALHFDHHDLRSRMRSRFQDDVMKRPEPEVKVENRVPMNFALIDNRDYPDYSDQDYEYRPRYQRRRYYRYRPERRYKRRDPRISNYWFSFGAKGKSKTNLRSESDTNIYGQRVGHKLERTGESDIETGLSLGEGRAEFNNKAASKGSVKAAGRFDTALGSGSGKTEFNHDVAGETGVTWD